MKKLGLCLLLLSSQVFAEEITSTDRFIDKKTGKYVNVCSQEGGKLVVKESCGKFWETFPNRTRADLNKEVKTYEGLKRWDTVMIPVKDNNGDVKMVLGKVGFMYEDGTLSVSEFYSKRLGYNPGTTNWTINYKNITKLNTAHPLTQYKSLCAKEATEFSYNWDGKRTFSLKKGEKVNLNGVFDNNTAMISLNQFGENFWGYGLNNQLPLSLDKLEVCEDERIVNDTSRTNVKESAAESSTEKQTDANSIAR